MRSHKSVIWAQKNVNFDPNPVTSMICFDILKATDYRTKPPRQKNEFLHEPIIHCGTRESSYVIKGCGGPVEDYEKGEETSSERVEPPDVPFVANCGKQKSESVEYHISFTI
jgi:hypothetical protein